MGYVTRVPSRYIVYGNSALLICGTNGGPRNNRRWHRVRVINGPAAGQVGWVADRYMNTPNAANRPTPGEPECRGGAPQSATASLVWLGAPVDSAWGGEPASPPSVHHWLGNARDRGDWAVDLPAGVGQRVVLYAAPQNSGVAVTARVDQLGDACINGRNGGKFVTVGLYSGSIRIGSATYRHINPSVSVGQSVSRWGTVVGMIGRYTVNSACWTGPHTHIQLYSSRNYACYNKGYRHNSPVRRTNFVGFTGGNAAGGPRRACA
jgi:hypothetical protein